MLFAFLFLRYIALCCYTQGYLVIRALTFERESIVVRRSGHYIISRRSRKVLKDYFLIIKDCQRVINSYDYLRVLN